MEHIQIEQGPSGIPPALWFTYFRLAVVVRSRVWNPGYEDQASPFESACYHGNFRSADPKAGSPDPAGLHPGCFRGYNGFFAKTAWMAARGDS